MSVLNPGAGVVTPRADAHWIVTEYGAVDLYGKSLQERAKLMISIAHPDDREMLDREAPDAVLVATPDFSHADIVCEALGRGIAVYGETLTVFNVIGMVLVFVAIFVMGREKGETKLSRNR